MTNRSSVQLFQVKEKVKVVFESSLIGILLPIVVFVIKENVTYLFIFQAIEMNSLICYLVINCVGQWEYSVTLQQYDVFFFILQCLKEKTTDVTNFHHPKHFAWPAICDQPIL